MPNSLRPRGIAWPVSEAWRRETLADMERAGISMCEMASRIACAPTALYGLLRHGDVKTSRLVSRIHDVLGKPAPSVDLPSTDPQLASLTERWPLLSQEEREYVCSFVDQRAASRKARSP